MDFERQRPGSLCERLPQSTRAEPADESRCRPIQAAGRAFVVTEPLTETPFRIEPLHDRHDRAAFSCGVEPLDHYLRTQAGQNLKKRVAAVFVVTPDGKTIAGFYTLSAHMLNLNDLPAGIANKLPKYPHLPTTLL